MRRGLRLALATCVLFGLAPTLHAADTAKVTEPSTGVAFDGTRSFPGVTEPLALTGTGVRKKMVFKVYAFALYVDPAATRAGLAACKGKDAGALANDGAVYAALAGLQGDRAAVLHFVRDVEVEKMREAMTEAMDRGVPKGDPAREAFLKLWTASPKSGEEVVLVFGAKGAVSLVRDAKIVGTVESAALARSLLQSWLGPEPVSEDIQKGVVARLPALL